MSYFKNNVFYFPTQGPKYWNALSQTLVVTGGGGGGSNS